MSSTPTKAKLSGPSCEPPAGQCGIYISPMDFGSQTAEQIHAHFEGFAPVAQVRVKRTRKVKNPFALVWFKTPEDAKKAMFELKKSVPEGTLLEWIESAKPEEARVEFNSTLQISPLAVPARTSKGYPKLGKKIRELFPTSIRVRLHRAGEEGGCGSAVVFFNSDADANAAKDILGGKLFGNPITVTHSSRTLDAKQRTRTPTHPQRAALEEKLEVKISDTMSATVEKTKALAKDSALAHAMLGKGAHDKAVEAATEVPNFASGGKQRKETRPIITGRAGAPAFTPPAATAARQPTQHSKVPSRKSVHAAANTVAAASTV